MKLKTTSPDTYVIELSKMELRMLKNAVDLYEVAIMIHGNSVLFSGQSPSESDLRRLRYALESPET